LKNKRPLTILFIANAVSSFAQGITMIAIPWYFNHTLKEPQLFMLAFAAINFGLIFWSLYAGDIVDGFNRKDVFLGSNFIQGLIILSVASLGFKEGDLPVGLILMVFTITFFGYYIHYPNLYAYVQEITEPEYYTRVIAYIEIIGQSVTMLAGLIGGVLLNGIDLFQIVDNPFTGQPWFEFNLYIKQWQLYEIILFNAIAYFVSFITIIFIRAVALKEVVHEDEGNVMVRLNIGYNYLKSHKLVTIFALCSFSIFIIILVDMFALRSMYVQYHLLGSSIVYGFSEVLMGGGAFLAAGLIVGILSKMPIPKSIIIMVMMTTAALIWMGFNDNVFILFLLSFILGFTNAGSRIFRVSYLFRLIPNEMAGRVNSILNVIGIIIRIILIVLFSAFASGTKVTYAYLALGGYTLISGLILIYLYKPLLKLTESIGTGNEKIADE
jgi:DHA3 family macrolide efflux protein-like MFS transporter